MRLSASAENRGAAREDAEAENPPAEPPAPTLDAALRAMEPALPAPPEELLDPEDLEEALLTANIADGTLPHFLAEQGPVKTDAQRHAEKLAAMHERGRLLDERMDEADRAGEAHPDMTEDEYADWCLYIDPAQASDVPRKQRRKR